MSTTFIPGVEALALLPQDGREVQLRAERGHLIRHVSAREAVQLIHMGLVDAQVNREPVLKHLRARVEESVIRRALRDSVEGQRLNDSTRGAIAEDSRTVFKDRRASEDPGIYTYQHDFRRSAAFGGPMRFFTGFRSDGVRVEIGELRRRRWKKRKGRKR